MSEDDLVKILIEPKNALIKQYKKLIELEGVDLEITDKASRAIAKEAIKRKTGARGLRAILESVMLDVMYQIPSMDNVKTCVIDENVIYEKAQPVLIFQEKAEEDRKLRIS